MRTLFILLLFVVSQYAHAMHVNIHPNTKLGEELETTHGVTLTQSSIVSHKCAIQSQTEDACLRKSCPQIPSSFNRQYVSSDRIETNLKLDTCGPVSFDVYITDENCPGDCDWEMEIDATEGFPPFTYLIEGDSCGGFITVFATDAMGCTDSMLVFIYSLPDLVPNMIEIIDATNGQTNGSIEVNAEGGSPPYMYSLDGINYQSSPFFNDLSPGSYCITIQDSHGCTTKTDSFTIDNSTSTLEFTPNLKIYPNPANTYLLVESDTPVALDLLDVIGKILKQSPYSKAHEFVVSEFPRGLYFLRLGDGFRYTFQRIALQ